MGDNGVQVNYYEILGVSHGSSIQDIKRSFRKKAKRLHPDLNRAHPVKAAEDMRLLLLAYQILSDHGRREEYDRTVGARSVPVGFDYRLFLKSQKNNMVSQSRLILHDLLRDRQEDATELFERLSQRASFHLDEFLPREDFLDCFFLLAETYEMHGDLRKSFTMYKKIYCMELELPYFRHFIEEIIDRIRNLACFKMVEAYGSEEALSFLEETIELNFSRRDNAFFYKKMAEIHANTGAWIEARKCLDRGLLLDDKLPGIKKLRDRIQVCSPA
jgi:curved DNA-binding protein CbpA